MIKTIKYSAGVTTVDFSEAHPYGASNRYYAVVNYGKKDIFISNKNDAAEGADGSKRVPAGECRGIDMQGLNVLYIAAQSAGTAEIDTAAGISALGFRSSAKGGDSVSEGEGNPVQIDGLQGGVPFNSVVVSGKNLIPFTYRDGDSKTINGVTFTVNSDGSVTANGTATTNATFFLARNFGFENEGNYILSGCPSGGGNNSFYINWFQNHTGVTQKNYNDYGSGIIIPYQHIFSENNALAIAIIAGATVENLIFRPQLELGDTATEYAPPITGRDLTVGVSGKNLMKYPYYNTTQTQNGVTFTDNGDGSITVNGTATATAYFSLSSNKALPTGKYVWGKSMDNILIYVDEYLDNAFYQRLATSTETIKELIFNVSEEDAQKYTYKFGIQINKGNTEDNVTIYPQLEIGDSATPYEPYHGAEYTITPNSNPYTVPVDIIQQKGLNVLSIADDSNPTISVSGNKASEQLGMIFRTLDNKPVLLFDGNIPTSSLDGYAEFTVDKEYTALMVVPTCNTSSTYILGVCTVIPMSYIESTEKDFTVTGSPRGTDTSSRAYIKRDGNTIYVRETSTTCDYMTIYGI